MQLLVSSIVNVLLINISMYTTVILIDNRFLSLLGRCKKTKAFVARCILNKTKKMMKQLR